MIGTTTPTHHQKARGNRTRIGYLTILLLMVSLAAISACKTIAPETVPEPEEVLTLEEETYQGLSFFIQTGEPEKAINAFERAMADDPDDPDTAVLYAVLLMSAGLYEQAEEELNSVLEEHPEHTEALFNLALLAGLRNEPEEKEKLVRAILKIDDNHAKANATMGEIQMSKRRHPQAERYFAKSLAGDETNLVALIGYGNALRHNSKHNESLEALNKAIELGPDYSFAYVDRAKTRLRLRDSAGADQDLSTAIELEPDFYWHYLDRGKIRLIEMGNMATALEDFNRAIDIDPDFFYAYTYRGAIYLEQFEIEKALADLEFVHKKVPEYDRIWAQLGCAYYMSGKFRQAARIFGSDTDRRSRREHHPRLLQVIALHRAGREDEARRLAAEHFPRIPREDMFYHITRAFSEHGYEAIAFRTLQEQQDRALKTLGSFYMAQLYEILQRPTLAQRLYLQVSEANILELDETRLAIWELRKLGIN